jgi:hypothetical protein
VDIETGNVTGSDDSQNENEHDNEIENNNQPFIADDNEQPGIVMESEETNP